MQPVRRVICLQAITVNYLLKPAPGKEAEDCVMGYQQNEERP